MADLAMIDKDRLKRLVEDYRTLREEVARTREVAVIRSALDNPRMKDRAVEMLLRWREGYANETDDTCNVEAVG